MNETINKSKHLFSVGDKVIHHLSEDEHMIGTVKHVKENDICVVEFWVEGRRKAGYTTEVEFNADEIHPCYVNVESTKRNHT